MTMLDTTRPTAPRVAYVATAWAAGYGVLALVWTITGAGFPFGRADPHATISLLRNLPAGVGAPVFAGVLLATAVLVFAMSGRFAVRPPATVRSGMLAAGWAVAAALVLVVPDVRLLTLAGYAPMLLLGAPFGWPAHVDYADVFTWALVNQAVCLAGGVLVARTVLAWQRRTRDGDGAGEAFVVRWSAVAAYVAATIPALYALTRFAWLAGIPLGISEEFLRELHRSGGVWAGAGLGAFAVVGSVLTLGLVRPWGEVFPRWMAGLAGRRVPVRLATVPASVVAMFVTSAGIAVLAVPEMLDKIVQGEMTILPMALWPVWGVALGVATYGYHLRRSGWRALRSGYPSNAQ
jgi:hypothetical protein